MVPDLGPASPRHIEWQSPYFVPRHKCHLGESPGRQADAAPDQRRHLQMLREHRGAVVTTDVFSCLEVSFRIRRAGNGPQNRRGHESKHRELAPVLVSKHQGSGHAVHTAQLQDSVQLRLGYPRARRDVAGSSIIAEGCR